MRLPLLLTLAFAAGVAAPAQAQEKVTICHSTGRPDPPYVELTLDNAGVLEHVNHEDDLVPAPEGGCPTTTVVDGDDTPAATPTPQYQVPTPTPTPTATATPAPTPMPDRGADRDREEDGGGARGGGGGGDDPTLSASPPEAQARSVDTRHLPMTGAEMWLVAAAGLGFLLTGFGVRLLNPPASGRPPGPSGR